LGLKGGQSRRRFRQENFESTNFSKTRQKPLGPREKLLGGPVWSYKFSSRGLKIILSAVFGGAKLTISPARWDLGHEANPKKLKSMMEPPDFSPPERI
jgi:hypothetical protein